MTLGSVWRKWDLHIHTPASFHWNGGGKAWGEQSELERKQTCTSILEKFEELDIDAFCIMDYWTFDGYLHLRRLQQQNPELCGKKIFPGIELRLEAPTDFRLNIHVLLNDSLSEASLGHFLAYLRTSDGKPPHTEHFIEVAKSYDTGKLRHHGFNDEHRSDDKKMLELGIKTVVVTRQSLEAAIDIVGEENCLIIQPYDTSDGLEDLSWKRHPHADSVLMKWADIFEARDKSNVDLFLGKGHTAKPRVQKEFLENLGGYPKPVVSGSDAHKIADYGVYPSERITWLKAQPTFGGLRQVCHEPGLRCYIGKLPPKMEHIASNPTKYMKRLALRKIDNSDLDEVWFDGVSIDFNPGLIAIIGNKGSGKSALADILALACNSGCTDMEFLTDKRFKANKKAQHFEGVLSWCDGSDASINLDDNYDLFEPERVRYLPQHFIETLCNEVAGKKESSFERELKKVIFNHLPEERRLRKLSLDELLNFSLSPHYNALTQLRTKLGSINEQMVVAEENSSKETIKGFEKALTLKEKELEAHDKGKPNEITEPTDDDIATKSILERLSEKEQELEQLNSTISTNMASQAEIHRKNELLNRIESDLTNLERAYSSLVEDHFWEFVELDVKQEEVIGLTTDRGPLSNKRDELANQLVELEQSLKGAEGTAGLHQQLTNCQGQVTALKQELGAPHRIYQNYLGELKRWQQQRDNLLGSPDKINTVEFYKGKIKEAKEELPVKLENWRKQRRDVTQSIHNELLAMRDCYRKLYEPVQNIAAHMEYSNDPIAELRFDAFLVSDGFLENFLDFIHKGKKGSFYGEQESRTVVQKLLSSHDFNQADSLNSFMKDLGKRLTQIDRDGTIEHIDIKSQLRPNKKLVDLYNFIFGLEYLEPRYTLKLGNKDISQLSPGEKGALLLVFYLLLDTEEIPIIIDQPEQNLDNESVVKLLVGCIRHARSRRQVVIVTHNPNLAVVCDADQLVYCSIDKSNGNKVSYVSGAIEDSPINRKAVDVLEGTYAAFDNRRKKYLKQTN
jgi:ABC-type lipoprotein export system ATPase subunit